ncbi:MAG: HDIG domain-containing protein [Bacteroidales bacterium]|nr:HDIG domain-containing protein [Bacteroidales bacterium]
MLIVAALLAAAAPRAAKLCYDYKKGGVWNYETLYAPFDFPIMKTSEEIMEEMDRASGVRVPYYKYSDEVTRGALLKAATLDLGEYSPAVLEALGVVLERGVISDDSVPEGSGIIYVQKEKRALKVPAGEVSGLSAARASFVSELRKAGVPEAADSLILASSVSQLIVPNLTFDEQITEAVNEESRRMVSPTEGFVSAGQLIVSKGEIITADIARILDSYKREYESSVGSSGPVYLNILGNVMVALLLVVLLLLSILFSGKSFFVDTRYYYLVFVFALFAGMIMLLVRFYPMLLYMAPLTLCALYLQAFVRARVIVPVYIISLLPLLIYADHGASLFVIFLAGGLVSIYCSRYLVQGWKQFLLALINFVAMALVYIALRLTGGEGGIFLNDLLRLLVAALLAVFLYPLIYLFEKIFNLVSNSRLVELADTSNPVLRELELKAPGTFQHSLQVMNMADAAARAIDANPLLLRVGALYHDIGKLSNPMCFIENESLLNKPDDQKYHSGLSPEQSAEDIIKHVSDGVDAANAHRLPSVVVDFIRTHHGTTVTGYFWSKYLSGGGNPEARGKFSYPGPAPTTKEQIILMLCDSIEAASRTLTNYTPEAYSAFVEKMVQGKMDQGQFDNADISIKELALVKEAIKNYLAQMHHGRVVYPHSKRNILTSNK